MLAKIRRHLASKHSFSKESTSYGDGDDDDNDDLHTFAPPTNYIKISQGKIQLVNQSKLLDNDATTTVKDTQSVKDKEVLESRIYELEGALERLQTKVENNSKSQTSPVFEHELREQLESMNRVMKSKEQTEQQTCRDHRVLQVRFTQQEKLLQSLQRENKALILRVRQYEHCLDDVMRKVVDAIVAEDNLREEVAMLKNRVRDLEALNAQLNGGSPAKGRDEGYCTMSSGQPQPSNSNLEDLPEEPEQWLLPAEPCSTEMEDWSMSQEELAVITLDDEREHQHQQQHQHYQRHHLLHLQQQQGQQYQFQYQQRRRNCENNWIWNSQDFLNSTLAETDSISDGISQLLQQKIVYSEDEEITCTDFTKDFYKLVNIRPGSARSLYSCIEGDTDDEDDDDEENDENDDNDNSSVSGNNYARLRTRTLNGQTKSQPSPTPSEAGRAQVTSCTSSESDESSTCAPIIDQQQQQQQEQKIPIPETVEIETTQNNIPENESAEIRVHQSSSSSSTFQKQYIKDFVKKELKRPPHILVKSKSTIESTGETNSELKSESESEAVAQNSIPRCEFRPTGVVRSGSVNCEIPQTATTTTTAAANWATPLGKANGRFPIDQRPQNSWRKCNGWKRVISPVPTPKVASLKKEPTTTTTTPRQAQPTKIPTCVVSALPTPTTTTTATRHNFQQQQQQQQQQKEKEKQLKQRKSKIPPPVPVRRSYAS